jgi:glutamate 5-kinase
MVAILVKADLLIMLSDIDGLYESAPSINPNARLISYVSKIDENIYNIAGGAETLTGTGGMFTKIKAAENLMENGIRTVIASGENINIIYSILEGEEIGTFFGTAETREEDYVRAVQ